MNKILEKIYVEKDIPTNVSIFVGSVVALFVYLSTNDPYLSLILFVGTFSLTKVISKVIINKISKTNERKINLKSYSQTERDVINVFISNGSCFLTLSDLRKGKVEVDEHGLDSLVARGIIEFIDGSMGDGPTGFQLSEDVYKLFLEK